MTSTHKQAMLRSDFFSLQRDGKQARKCVSCRCKIF